MPGAVTGAVSSQPRSANATLPGQVPGMNIQFAADLDGRIAAIGSVPVPGGRHDAHAGLKGLMAKRQREVLTQASARHATIAMRSCI